VLEPPVDPDEPADGDDPDGEDPDDPDDDDPDEDVSFLLDELDSPPLLAGSFLAAVFWPSPSAEARLSVR
jgi:hypothetical protein